MHVLIGCESSGQVRRAFRELGHVAWSCDLLPADDGSEFHLKCDVFDAIGPARPCEWDLAIFHPPCTYLSGSGLHWNTRGKIVDGRPRAELTEEALNFVTQLLAANIPRIALENPVGCISTRICKPDQIIQPHWFGDDASKATCLWLKNLPKLVPTKHVPPRCVTVNGKARFRWANQTDSGQNKLGPSEDRWKKRSETYAGIAAAMAEQWGGKSLTVA